MQPARIDTLEKLPNYQAGWQKNDISLRNTDNTEAYYFFNL